MRIISNFHDYYDCMMKQGYDPTIVYNREMRVLESKWKYNQLTKWPTFSINEARYDIGFCGKIYKKLDVTLLKASGSIKESFLDYDTFKSWALEHVKRASFMKESWKWSFLGNIRHWFREQPTKEELARFDEAPIWVESHGELVYNANLAACEFFRIMPTQQAYQELSMYMANKAIPMKPIPKIDDKTMAEIKGFNKHSFRKGKST